MVVTLQDALDSLWSEIVIFCLVVICYKIFTLRILAPRRQKAAKKTGHQNLHKPPSEQARSTRKPPAQSLRQKGEILPEEHVSLLQASEIGDAIGALQAMSQLPARSLMALPSSVAAKVLLCLGKTSSMSEEMMHQFMDLAGSFDTGAFETAAAETCRLCSIPSCRRLYDLAGLASARTEKFLIFVVKGHRNDVSAMCQMIGDVLAECPSKVFKRSLANALVAQCTKGENQATAQIIKDHVELQFSRQDANRLARLISQLGKQGRLHDAINAFDRAQLSGAPLDTSVHNSLLGAFIECKELSKALDHFAKMEGQSLTDAISYYTMIEGCTAAKKPEAAHRLVMEMINLGLQPNKATLHNVISLIAQKRNFKVAWNLINKMISQGIERSGFIWTTLLKHMTRQSHVPELSETCALIESHKVAMDPMLFSFISSACIRCGCLDLLWSRLLLQWQGDTSVISPATYASIMKAYGQARDVQKVKHLWAKMTQDKVQILHGTLNYVVEVLNGHGLAEESWAVVSQCWEDPERRELVNTSTYSFVVNGFTIAKQHDKVLAVYQEMKERQIPCNKVTFNTMLNAMARCGMMHELPQLLDDMRNCTPPIEPDIVTFSTIIKGFCLSGDLDKAFELLSLMRNQLGIKPDGVLYNSLLDGCARQSRFRQAMVLFEEMKEAGVAPSNFTLSIMCKLLGRAKLLNQAFSMVQSVSHEYCFELNIQVYTSLMQACFTNGKCQRALDLHNQIVAEGRTLPDRRTYTVMARGCLAGDGGKAADVVRCAFHLPGHCMQQTTSAPPGVDDSCLAEVLDKLGRQGTAARALIEDLKDHCGIDTTTLAARKMTPAPKHNQGYAARGRWGGGVS
eukprot:TRINITY_DN321_c0_g1_i1.p1 TRINITY_DN321_c0_g1~~TRINITY_DN321_c0_g1_i1.p1  ORF type:complete len:854 (-),score=164.03 TRINITY_DN321_c0_g1_i1:268-2829(-)